MPRGVRATSKGVPETDDISTQFRSGKRRSGKRTVSILDVSPHATSLKARKRTNKSAGRRSTNAKLRRTKQRERTRVHAMRDEIERRNALPLLTAPFEEATLRCGVRVARIREVITHLQEACGETGQAARPMLVEVHKLLQSSSTHSESTEVDDDDMDSVDQQSRPLSQQSTIARLETAVQELVKRFEIFDQAVVQIQAEQQQLQSALASLTSTCQRCEQDNIELATAFDTLRDRYTVERNLLVRHVLQHARADPELRSMQNSNLSTQVDEPPLCLIPSLFR